MTQKIVTDYCYIKNFRKTVHLVSHNNIHAN